MHQVSDVSLIDDPWTAIAEQDTPRCDIRTGHDEVTVTLTPATAQPPKPQDNAVPVQPAAPILKTTVSENSTAKPKKEVHFTQDGTDVVAPAPKQAAATSYVYRCYADASYHGYRKLQTSALVFDLE